MDMSINNWSCFFRKKKTIIDHTHKGCDIIISEWFWPRNSILTMRWWRKKFAAQVHDYIDNYGPPDVIHAHTYLGAWVAGLVKSLYNIPIIVSEHYTAILDNSINSIHRTIAQEAYQCADQIYAVSQALAEAIEIHYGHQVGIFSNFVDTALFSPNLLNEEQTSKDLLKVICIGDLIPRKQIDVLIRTLRKHPSLSLSIVGAGPEKNQLSQLVQQLNLEERVSFLGQKTQSEISELLKRHDFLIHPSRLETFGIVLIEALSSGLPIISYDNGGAKDIINQSNGILVTTHSEEALSSAIDQFLKTRTLYSADIIRLDVLQKYSASVAAKKLYDIYVNLISK